MVNKHKQAMTSLILELTTALILVSLVAGICAAGDPF